MMSFLYVLAVLALGVGLVVFSYLDRIYRELGRVNKGRVREHLEYFEKEIEPHFRLDRARGTTGFRLLANLWLVLVTAETARGVIVFVRARGMPCCRPWFTSWSKSSCSPNLFPISCWRGAEAGGSFASRS
jgi:hypothetical protein